jgi:hypothetical protein
MGSAILLNDLRDKKMDYCCAEFSFVFKARLMAPDRTM